MNEAPFKVRDCVETKKGASFCGVVASIYNLGDILPVPLADPWRVDVVATDVRFFGTIHVYPASQLRLAP